MYFKLLSAQIEFTSGEKGDYLRMTYFFVLIADRMAKFAFYNTNLLMRPLHFGQKQN